MTKRFCSSPEKRFGNRFLPAQCMSLISSPESKRLSILFSNYNFCVFYDDLTVWHSDLLDDLTFFIFFCVFSSNPAVGEMVGAVITVRRLFSKQILFAFRPVLTLIWIGAMEPNSQNLFRLCHLFMFDKDLNRSNARLKGES
jgi:hypothetical protein